MPAGRNRSTLCTGIIKQSLSRVANDMGSERTPPGKETKPLLFPPVPDMP